MPIPPPAELASLLTELRAVGTFAVLTGRVPATGRSASYAVAQAQSLRLLNNPHWYAETGGIQMTITREQHELLLRHGAANDVDLQIIRTFANQERVTFSDRCRRCRRWIWCGDEELEDACVCGAKYRIALDLAEVDQSGVREEALCMDCGAEYRPREHLLGPQPWNVINGGQVQCPDCFQKRAEI